MRAGVHVLRPGAIIAGVLVASAAPVSAQAPGGYLKAPPPNVAELLPPPPLAGSPGEAFERAAFQASRRLAGSARWREAQADDSPAGFPNSFGCAMGLPLSAATTPRTVAMMRRLGSDTNLVTTALKIRFKRPRPFLRNGGPICLPKDPALVESFDYPSGHAASGWAIALLLAELAPDRATEALQRGRAIGESRWICGVHTVSAVEAGREAGAATFALAHASPAAGEGCMARTAEAG